MPQHKEADIVVSGVKLTEAQSMTVRVALQDFMVSLERDGLGDDENGKALTLGYQGCIRDINQLLMRTAS